MTVQTADAPPRVAATSSYRLSFARVLRGELLKLTTVRSTWWSLAIAAVLSIGISVMVASASSSVAPGFPAINAIVMPMQFTMLVAGILGAISVTGEYSTGMIRSTLTAEPRRGAVLLAKAIVVGALMALTQIVVYAVSIAATAPFFSEGIDWGSAEHSIIPLAWGVFSMVAFALIGLGFGFIVRNGAGAIAATVGLLFVLPIVTSLFSIGGETWQWIVDLGRYLPMNASTNLTTGSPDDATGAFLAMLGWALALLATGWGVLRSRDA
jgi:ABC-2 type transport system permease protein